MELGREEKKVLAVLGYDLGDQKYGLTDQILQEFESEPGFPFRPRYTVPIANFLQNVESFYFDSSDISSGVPCFELDRSNVGRYLDRLSETGDPALLTEYTGTNFSLNSEYDPDELASLKLAGDIYLMREAGKGLEFRETGEIRRELEEGFYTDMVTGRLSLRDSLEDKEINGVLSAYLRDLNLLSNSARQEVTGSPREFRIIREFLRAVTQ